MTAVTSGTAFTSVVLVRRILREAVGTLWWVDPQFSRRALEDIAVEISDSDVDQIRIISRGLSPKDQRDYERFAEEMSNRNINAEWRLTHDQRLFHDRFIAFDGRTVNVPPVNLIYQRDVPYSEINESTVRPPFEEWWSKSEPVPVG